MNEHIQKTADYAEAVTVKLKRGAYYCKERCAWRDEMVDIGLLSRNEGQEPWGYTVVYCPTEKGKAVIAKELLSR